MNAIKIAIGLAVVIAGYAGFHVQSATEEIAVADIQSHQCAGQECATVFTMPPSSNLFL